MDLDRWEEYSRFEREKGGIPDVGWPEDVDWDDTPVLPRPTKKVKPFLTARWFGEGEYITEIVEYGTWAPDFAPARDWYRYVEFVSNRGRRFSGEPGDIIIRDWVYA